MNALRLRAPPLASEAAPTPRMGAVHLTAEDLACSGLVLFCMGAVRLAVKDLACSGLVSFCVSAVRLKTGDYRARTDRVIAADWLCMCRQTVGLEAVRLAVTGVPLVRRQSAPSLSSGQCPGFRVALSDSKGRRCSSLCGREDLALPPSDSRVAVRFLSYDAHLCRESWNRRLPWPEKLE